MEITTYIKTFILAATVLFFALQKGNGFFFLIFLLFFVVMMLYSLVRMAWRPDERKRRLIRVAIWAVTFTFAGAVQIYWNTASRADADRAATTVLAYRDRTGVYPASLEELGLDEEGMDKWRIRYWIREGKAVLTYPASFMPLTMYEYDFDARRWQENAY